MRADQQVNIYPGLSIVIGDWQGRHLRAQQTWRTSVDVSVSLGATTLGYQLEPPAMRELAAWLTSIADKIDEANA